MLAIAAKTKRKRAWAEAFFPSYATRSGGGAADDEVEVDAELDDELDSGDE